MKPMNFPARKAARQRAAAERRLPQIRASLKAGSDHHQQLKAELASVEKNDIMLVMPFRDVRSKKMRGARTSF